MIILTQAQRDQVLKPTLQPRALEAGGFALGEAVLLDPEHADVRDILEACPKRAVLEDEWSKESLDA
ncbi:MAG: hypothetical protein IKE42_28265 [Aquamicrobium sp.]|nr:hypothetical protein [Aquamicrobium sp.]